MMKFGRVVFELCEQTDRQTDRQAYSVLITILRTPPRGQAITTARNWYVRKKTIEQN